MTSVVSTVAGGLETPDFLELRKGRSVSEAMESSGPRSLYQVVPEKQTSVRGLMGSERGYDVSAVSAGASIPVLGDERGTKVWIFLYLLVSYFKHHTDIIVIISARRTAWMCLWMLENWKVCQRRNCAGNTTVTLGVMPGYLELEVEVKISPTWWQRRWRRRSKKWIENETARRVERSSSSNMFSLPCLFVFP